MRRSGNSEETKRILMDLDVVVRSHDCPYIVRCLGCFVTDADVWICMELMASCFDKLLKRLGAPIPEIILGKVTVAVSVYLARSKAGIRNAYYIFVMYSLHLNTNYPFFVDRIPVNWLCVSRLLCQRLLGGQKTLTPGLPTA